MLHARPDYARIQDPEGKIGVDEPVFLIRAQDITAPNTVRKWAAMQKDPLIFALAMKHANAMEDWQREHGCKAADLPADYREPT